MATHNWNGALLTVTAPPVQQATQASKDACATQAAIEAAWKQANPNKVYYRGWVGGNIGGEG